MFLHIFAHIYSDDCLLAIEQKLCQGSCQLCFPHPCRSHENERPNGAVGILKTGSSAPYSIGNSFNRLLLTDDTLTDPFFHLNQLVSLAFQHLADGYTGPAGNNLSHIFGIDFLLEHTAGFLLIRKFLVSFDKTLFEVGLAAIADFGDPGKVTLAFRPLRLYAKALLLFLIRPNRLDQIFLVLPVAFHLI